MYERIELSLQQERTWFLAQLERDNPRHHACAIVRASAPLDHAALTRALGELARRHDALRTTVFNDGGTPRGACWQAEAIAPALLDREVSDEAAARAVAVEELRRPFDLERGPLLRCLVLRLGPREHWLAIAAHRLVADDASLVSILDELALLRDGQPLPPAPRYAEFVARQREALRTGDAAELAYWKGKLAGLSPTLSLPTRGRAAVRAFHGARLITTLPDAAAAALRRLCAAEGCSTEVASLALLQALLFRYSGQDDIPVGVPVRASVDQGRVGPCENHLVIRADFSARPTFRTLLRQLHATVAEARAHAALPFERLVDELKPERNLGSTPLFQVALLHHAQGDAPARLGTPLTLDLGVTQRDLTMLVVDSTDQPHCELEYDRELFDPSTIARLAAHWQRLAQAALADPDRATNTYPLLDERERAQLVVEWNQTALDFPQQCIHELVGAQARRTPASIAVEWEGQALRYAELDARAEQLATYLRAQGVGPDVMVGLCVERSLEMVVGLLGILKAGGAYVPLDPSYPKDRLALVIEDARLAIVLTQARLRAELPAGAFTATALDEDWPRIAAATPGAPAAAPTPRHLAYVIYTSGSTGKPKGVMLEHRSVVSFFQAMDGWLAASPGDTWLAVTSMSFDISVLELFWTLSRGLRVVLWADRAEVTGMRDDAPRRSVAQLLRDRQPAFLQCTPSMAKLLMGDEDAREQLRCLRAWLIGGEAMPASLAQHIKSALPCRLLNMYGPTETTIWSTVHEVADGEANVPIGRPLGNNRTYLLDGTEPVPIGVAAELLIGGESLARGYWQRPELTAERFVPDPFTPGARLYRTGDLARYRPDGVIEYLGRTDYQVKVRGFRVELGEIEAALHAHPGVHEAVVVAVESGHGDKQLVAYWVARGAEPPTLSGLRQHLKARLPDYMVPSTLMRLEALPLTPNGKVDRRALPAPTSTRPQLQHGVVAPRDDVELELVGLWEDLFGVHPIGVTDDFFELGGHSLLAVRLLVEIDRRFGRDLPVSALFQGATIAHLAGLLRERGAAPAWSSLVPLQRGTTPALFLVHPVGGNVLSYIELARRLGRDKTVYGIQSQGLDGKTPPQTSMTELATCYIELIRGVQPHGPYLLGGWSSGGIVAFEMAQQLRAVGEKIGFLGLLDARAPDPSRREHVIKRTRDFDDAQMSFWLLVVLGRGVKVDVKAEVTDFEGLSPEQRLARLLRELQALDLLPPDAGLKQMRTILDVYKANMMSLIDYAPRSYDGSAVLFQAEEPFPPRENTPNPPPWGWEKFVARLECHPVPGNHFTVLHRDHIAGTAEQMRAALERALASLDEER